MSDTNGEVDGLLDRIYDVALAPERLGELVDQWSQVLGSDVMASRYGALAEPGILGHVIRAERIQREVTAARHDHLDDALGRWLAGARGAALVVDRSGSIVAANRAAQRLLNARVGSPFMLPVDDADMQLLLRSLRSHEAAGEPGERLLLLSGLAPDAPVLVRILAAIGGDDQLVGLFTSILNWPNHLSAQLQEAFGLTRSEVEVLRDITLGQTVKMIAERSGRSEPTVRTHVKAILGKAGVRSQLELVRLTLGLLEPIEPMHQVGPPPAPVGMSLERNDYRTHILSDGRRLDYLEIGASGGRPFLMLPTDMGFTRLTRNAERHLAEIDMRMVVPVRAGYGKSSPLPKSANAFAMAVSDMEELCDHLGIVRYPILALCDDFHLAILAAHAASGRVSAIVALGPTMPAVERRHFERMPKWTRFIIASARYAPATLPFLALALLGFMRRLGPRRALQMFMADSPADRRILDDDEVFAALLLGLGDHIVAGHTAHTAWAAGTICNHGVDWSERLRTCPVPMIVFAGRQDPIAPIETTREYAATLPRMVLHEIPDLGQLLYPIWPQFLGEIAKHLD
jgi:pimeloyl-ACP methyl ester carboxylesterase/DNA-binding CsgD family transcriptional regulator